MDFASALERFERDADAASQNNRGGRGGGRGDGRGGRGRGRWGDDRGGGGYRDNRSPPHHHHHHQRHHQQDYNRGPHYGGGRGGYRNDNSNDNPRRRERHDQDSYNNNRRHYPRPRLSSEDRGGGGGGREYYGGRGRGRSDYHHHSHHHSHHHHRGPPKQNPLDELRSSGFRIDTFRPPSELPSDLGTRPFHICLLAIIIDSMPYEHIWRHWAAQQQEENNNGNCRVSLLVHAKFPDRVQSEFVKQRLITEPPRMGRGNSYADPEYLTHTPEWGSIQITRAMVDLLRIGHRIGTPPDLNETDRRFTSHRFFLPNNNNDTDGGVDDKMTIIPADKFLYISETCLPVQSLAEFVEAFFGSPELYQKAANNGDSPSSEKEDGNNDSSETPGATATDQKEMKDEEGASEDKVSAVSAEAKTDTEKDQTTSSSSSSSAAAATRHTTPWEVSWINGRSRNTPGTPRNKYERDQFADIHRRVHGHYRWKADQWLCLSRLHASAICNMDAHMPHCHQLWNSFSSVSASDEMYMPCALAVLGILTLEQQQQQEREQQQQQQQPPPSLPPISTSSLPIALGQHHQVAFQAVTFTDWSEGMRNPATFCNGKTDLERVATKARLQGSVVARKFALQRAEDTPVTGAITEQEWQTVVTSCQEREQVAKAEAAAAAAAKQQQEEEAQKASAATTTAGEEAPEEGKEEVSSAEEGEHGGKTLEGEEDQTDETKNGHSNADMQQEETED